MATNIKLSQHDNGCRKTSVDDSYHVDTDPDPAFLFDPDPDPTFCFDVDSDPNKSATTGLQILYGSVLL
jgi:hypothetical protein